MQQRAFVLRVNESTAVVRPTNPGRSCGNCGGCVRLTGDRRPKEQELQVDNPIAAQVGELVVVESSPADLAKMSLVMYGTPLVGLVLGYLLAYGIWGTDTIGAVGAAVGLLVFAFLTRPVAERVSSIINRPAIVARACSTIDSGPTPACHQAKPSR